MRVVWIYGLSCTGKSSTAWALFTRLRESTTRVAHLEMDQLAMQYPEVDGDPGRHILRARSAAAVIDRYAAWDVEVVLLSGVLDPGLLEHYEGSLGTRASLSFCQLTARRQALRQRNVARGRPPDVVASMFDDASALDGLRDRHTVVDTDGRTVDDVATLVGRAMDLEPGMPRPGPGRRAARPAPSAPAPSAPSTRPGRALLVSGAAASGKSAVAWRCFQRMLDRGERVAYLDVHQLTFCTVLPDDPELHSFVSQVVASLWEVFAQRGTDCLVLSGDVTPGRAVELYRGAVPETRLLAVRLQVSEESLRRNIAARAAGAGPHLADDRLLGQDEGYQRAVLEEAVERQHRSSQDEVADVVVDVGEESVGDVASSILQELAKRG